MDLKLVHGGNTGVVDRGTDTWFIPGSSCAVWVGEILSWRVPLEPLRIVIVAAAGSMEPVGVVVSGAAAIASARTSIARPYQRLAERLLVPAEAGLFPAVTERELSELLDRESIVQYVWHPIAGLIGYEAADMLSIDRLLCVPKPGDARWLNARPGVRLSDRLTFIRPEQELTVQTVMQQGGDDIGSEPNLDDAPRSPDESSTAGIRDAFRAIQRPFAQAAQGFANRVPQSANSRTWVNAMQDWARKVLQSGGASLSRRENELKRLLNMLQNDPDKGLRFAIPFGGENGHRGLAPPSDQLGERSVDYGAYQSGGAADYWDMSWEIQQQLQTQYRELALRETRLGRHRRAAYIYSNLLGDVSAAAAVLEAGGHYREAAVLYRDKLDKKPQAAECLRKAGLFAQAIDLFEELENWEAVAGIYHEIGEQKSALLAWNKAVTACEERDDYLRAATLLDEKLRDTDRAVASLQRGWVYSNSAGECLEQLFHLLGRDENATVACLQIESLLGDEYESTTRQGIAANTLSRVSHQFPAPLVRTAAADATRRIAARNLQLDQVGARFVNALRGLQPDDKLLMRDCDRFFSRDSGKRRPSTQRGERAHTESRIRMPSQVKWAATTSISTWMYAAGFSDDGLTVARWNSKLPESKPEHVKWYIPSGITSPVLLAACPGHCRPLVVHLLTDAIKKDFTRKGGPLGLLARNAPGSDVLALSVSTNGNMWVLTEEAHGLVLRWFGENDVPLAVHTLPAGLAYAEGRRVHLATAGSRVCVSVGRVLLTMHTDGSAAESQYAQVVIDTSPSQAAVAFNSADLPQQAVGIYSSGWESEPAVAVAFDDGGAVFWSDGDSSNFGHGLVRPVVCFTPQRDLIAVDEHGVVEIYRVNEQQLELTTTFTPYARKAVGVESLPAGRFSVCYDDGTIDVYRLRR